jgi:hypothetical protein
MSYDTCNGLGIIKYGVKWPAEQMAGLYWLASVLNPPTNTFVSIMLFLYRSRFSERATGRTVGETWFSFRHVLEILLENKQTGCRAHSTSYSMDTGAFSPGVKWPEHEANHWAPSFVKAKNAWSCISISLYLMACYLNEGRDSFAFTFCVLSCVQ